MLTNREGCKLHYKPSKHMKDDSTEWCTKPSRSDGKLVRYLYPFQAHHLEHTYRVSEQWVNSYELSRDLQKNR